MKDYRNFLQKRAALVAPVEPPGALSVIQRRNRENLARWRYHYTTGRVPPIRVIRRGEE